LHKLHRIARALRVRGLCSEDALDEAGADEGVLAGVSEAVAAVVSVGVCELLSVPVSVAAVDPVSVTPVESAGAAATPPAACQSASSIDLAWQLKYLNVRGAFAS
jgi:hypothetical protein